MFVIVFSLQNVKWIIGIRTNVNNKDLDHKHNTGTLQVDLNACIQSCPREFISICLKLFREQACKLLR